MYLDKIHWHLKLRCVKTAFCFENVVYIQVFEVFYASYG